MQPSEYRSLALPPSSVGVHDGGGGVGGACGEGGDSGGCGGDPGGGGDGERLGGATGGGLCVRPPPHAQHICLAEKSSSSYLWQSSGYLSYQLHPEPSEPTASPSPSVLVHGGGGGAGGGAGGVGGGGGGGEGGGLFGPARQQPVQSQLMSLMRKSQEEEA